MAVVRRKDGRWTVRGRPGYWPDDPGRTTQYFGRGEGARVAAANRDDELRRRKYRRRQIDSTTVLFHTLAIAYDAASKSTMQPSTYKGLKYRIKVLLDAFGTVPAGDITSTRVDKWVSMRLETVKRVTVHSDLTYLKRILAWGVEQRIIGVNPIANYRKPKRDDAIIQPPTMAETRAILYNADEHVKRALLLCYFTGARPGPVELFGMRFADINREAGIITIRSARKGAAPVRHLPLHRQLDDLSMAWETADGHRADYIVHFRGARVNHINTAFRYAKLASCITRRLRLYDFRHAPITAMLMRGIDIKTVSSWAGHTTPTTTARVYAHTNMLAARAAVDSIPDIDTTSCTTDPKNEKAAGGCN